MIIDWYTVIFQIINFLVLVFLLRLFLYKPIIRAMDEREQTIVQREEEAATRTEEAEAQTEAYRKKKEELKQKEEQLMEEARAAAEKEKHKLLEKARHDVDETRSRWQEAFEREKQTFIDELRHRIGQQACLIARRCLQDLADSDLEKLIFKIFLNKLDRLPKEERSALKEAVESSNGKLVLRSAFDSTDEQIENLKSGLQEIINGRQLDFKLEPINDHSLICGMEIDVEGYRLAWSIDSYIEGIEDHLLQELGQSEPLEQTGEVTEDG